MTLTPSNVFKNPIHFFAFGFGSGLLPFMPGTWGTVVGVIVFLWLCHLPLIFYLAVIFTFTLIGILLCDRSAQIIGVHDYPGIVWDEIVGFLWTMVGIPVTWYWILLGFILFRLFDIWKPWPIRWLDRRVMGGLGIMLDDLVAAFYAWILLKLLVFLISLHIYTANFFQ